MTVLAIWTMTRIMTEFAATKTTAAIIIIPGRKILTETEKGISAITAPVIRTMTRIMTEFVATKTTAPKILTLSKMMLTEIGLETPVITAPIIIILGRKILMEMELEMPAKPQFQLIQTTMDW